MDLQNYRFDTVADWAGKELGCSEWITIDQSRINGFADATGDHQWIHVDAERCEKESPFGAPIAHGFLTLSLLAKLLMDVGLIPSDVKQAINAGVSNVRFKTPVRVGQKVRARVAINEVQPKGENRLLVSTKNVLEVEGEEDPALSGEITVMLFR